MVSMAVTTSWDKVLGTSFNIRAYNGENNIKVAVRTGHVTVYREEKVGLKNISHPEQIFLTPNQQVVFEKKEENLVKTLVEKPIIILPSIEKKSFEYSMICELGCVLCENVCVCFSSFVCRI